MFEVIVSDCDLVQRLVYVMPSTRHTVSSEGVIFFYKLITFKLIHSYNVKHLTCTIFCNNGLQNIYKYMKVFNIYNIYIIYKNKTYTKIYQKVFSGHLVVCWLWLLMWSVQTSIFLKKGKAIISIGNRKFFRSRMTKQTSPLNSSRKI